MEKVPQCLKKFCLVVFGGLGVFSEKGSMHRKGDENTLMTRHTEAGIKSRLVRGETGSVLVKTVTITAFCQHTTNKCPTNVSFELIINH